MNLEICYLKIDVSCKASVNFQHISQNATPATEFAPCHQLRQPWRCDSQKTRNTTPLKCCACHATWRWRLPKCLRLPRKLELIFWKRRKSIAPAIQSDFRHVTKHVWMSRSAMPATRNEATRHWKPLKVTPVAELAIGTAIATSRDRPRTVANGWATSSEHTLNPQTPELNGNPCYAFGKKTHLFYVKLPKCRGCTKEMSLRWDEILSQKESMLGPVRFCLEYKLGPSYFSTCILASHWASQVV